MTLLARLSLANRAVVALTTALLILAGLFSITSLKQELLPSIDIPLAAIVTPLPGASPEVVEQQVTTKIESAVGGVRGLESLESSSSANLSVVTAELAYGTDIGQAQQQLQQAVNRSGATLPEDADPTVITGSLEDFPVLQLSVASSLPETELVAVIDEQLLPTLRGVEGVREATLTGARELRVEITLDPAALGRAGLGVDAVTTALQDNGVVIPAGTVSDGDRTLNVGVGQRLTSVQDVAGLPLASPDAAPGEAPLLLGDVATVESVPAAATSYARTNGQASLAVTVTKTPDGNTIGVSDGIRAAIPDLESALGQDGEITIVFDQAPFIQQSIEDLSTEGLLGLVFAVVVILLFLMSLRSTLVTAVSIPLSLLIAMIGLRSGGYSLNILTLGALTVAVGRVVDDSIVVMENIKRHLGYGEPKDTAILAAVKEVAGAVTASTITTAAVFVPIAIVGGQVGELFQPFAFTVAIALLASLFVALTIVPVLAYWFLRAPTDTGDVAPERDVAKERERQGRLQRSYLPALLWSLRHPAITLLIAVAVLGGTFGLSSRLETNFIGDSGQNTLNVTQTLPPATSLDATDAAAKQVEEVVARLDGVESYQVTVGSSSDLAQAAFLGGGGTNSAAFAITTDIDADQGLIEKELRSQLAGMTGVGDLTVSTGQAGFGVPPIEVVVQAEDDEALRQAAAAATQAMRDTSGTTDVVNNLANESPAIQVRVDRAAAAAAGTNETAIGRIVAGALRGIPAGSTTVDGAVTDVILRVGQVPDDVATLEALPVATASGPVPLGQVAQVEEVQQQTTLTRLDGQRTATVSATATDENLGGVTSRLQENLDALDLPEGATAVIAGVSADQEDAFADLGVALLASIAIVYLVMVGTFRSLLQPLILLVSIPFAATGALGLLLATGTPLGVPALIGMLMLVGIVVTNAIVLIDLVNQYRERGLAVHEAVVEGARYRLRPILMTAAATISALIPMSLGITGGSVFISQPLAIVVIGGLTTSTLLTLILVPVLYSLSERAKATLAGRRARRRAAGSPA